MLTEMYQICKEKQKKTCDVSELFETFGNYQVMQHVLICLPVFLLAMTTVNYVFVVGDVDYRCRIEKCEDVNSTVQYSLWWPRNNRDPCLMPVLKDGEEFCTNNSFTGEMVTCDRWIYENNDTVIAELNLACQPWKSHLIGTMHYIGKTMSAIVFGWTLDRFGRKPMFILLSVGGTLGCIKTFATSYYVYLIIEFLEALFTGSSYSVATVLLLEISSKKQRMLSGVIALSILNLGESMFAFIAMSLPYWKTLVFIINGPCILFIALAMFINESPRWQLVSGRFEQTKKTMLQIAKMNNLNIPELTNIDEVKLKEKFNIGQHEVKENVIQAFKSKEILKRLLVACTCRFTSTFINYGMLINSVWLPGDKYMNFFLSAVISVPGNIVALYLIKKKGRKSVLQVGYILCAALCISSAFTPARYSWAKLSLFLISKMVIAACFAGIVTYAMELFPTSVRGTLTGLASFASRVGGIFAPLTPILNPVSEVLVYTLFCCTAIISALLLCLTPETKDLQLFETIEQMHSKKKVNLDKNVPAPKLN